MNKELLRVSVELFNGAIDTAVQTNGVINSNAHEELIRLPAQNAEHKVQHEEGAEDNENNKINPIKICS